MPTNPGRSSGRLACLSPAAFWLLSATGTQEIDHLPDPGVDVEGDAFAAFEADQVRRYVGELPARERLVIQLRYGFSGRALSHAQTADFLGLSASTIWKDEQRALGRLRGRYLDELRVWRPENARPA